VVATIRSDSLDVLIDLGGYTGGGNRLRVLSRRVAPTQASFLGYPNTSAIPCMDYHFTDRFADPPGLTDHLYGEQLIWLQHAMLAWRPYRIADEIRQEVSSDQLDEAQGDSPPVLGLFNNVAKISPSAIKTYAAIMRRVPESRLILKYGDRYGVDLLRDRYRREFAAHGVLPHRLEFRTRAESLEQHLRTLASVDLALDSFPYQGTMTSLECLSVGTPIVSCCGDYYAHRATSAMMMRMGLFELIASDTDEYIEIAVQLLYDLPSLRAMRQVVDERFRSSPLTDPAGLTRELESHFTDWAS
jgi:predicted O-linked N-acetylglucosamine transferase (SPINDLY family)